MELTKRRVLQAVGIAASGVTGADIVAADPSEEGEITRNTSLSRNFGIYNNSSTTRVLSVTVSINGVETVSKSFELRGLNDHDLNEQSESRFQGSVHVPREGVRETRVRVSDNRGQTVETALDVAGTVIDDETRVWAKVRPSGELVLKEATE